MDLVAFPAIVAAQQWPARPALFLTWSGRLVPAGNSGQCTALEQALELLWTLESIARQSRRSWDDVERETFVVCARLLAGSGG